MSEEPSKLDQTKRAFANNRLFVIIAIIGIGVVGIAGVIKALADVKESADVLIPTNEETVVEISEPATADYRITATVIDENEQALKNVKAKLVDQEGLRESTDNNGVFYLRAQRKAGSIAKLRLQIDGYEIHEEQWELGEKMKVDLGVIKLKKIVKPATAKSPRSAKTGTTNDISNNKFSGPAYIGNGPVTVNNNYSPDSLKQ